jgi:hypothetical protein
LCGWIKSHLEHGRQLRGHGGTRCR